MADFYKLKAGQTLTATANEGRIHVRAADAGGESAFTHSTVAFGPYLVARDFLVDGYAAIEIADVLAPANALLFESDGAPDDAAQATLAVNPTGDDNGLTFTARSYGAEGNEITIEYVDPSANDAALAVSVFRQAIIVSLATGVAGAIESTAADVLAAVEAHGLANALVTVAIDASDSGSGDDGSGVVTAMAAAPLADGAGTGIDVVKPGGLLIDIANGDVYRNSGTQAAPEWTKLGDAA